MDEDLKQLAKMIREQNLGTVVEEPDSEMTVQDYANMEPPRPDMNRDTSDRYSKVKQMVSNLPNTLTPDENFVPSPRMKEVYRPNNDPNLREDTLRAMESFSQKPGQVDQPTIDKIKKMYGGG